MATLDFPNAPVNGQVFVQDDISWVWDGTKWTTGTGGFVQPMMVVNATTTLPAGYRGFVRIENSTNAPITITLPASPVASQEITLKDTYGNAGTYPVTITGEGPAIEGQVTLVLQYNYSWVDLIFTGAQWVQA